MHHIYRFPYQSWLELIEVYYSNILLSTFWTTVFILKLYNFKIKGLRGLEHVLICKLNGNYNIKLNFHISYPTPNLFF